MSLLFCLACFGFLVALSIKTLHTNAQAVIYRHYSRAVLRSVHRSLAIQQWKELQSKRHVPLEAALSAFDMFVSCDEELEFDTVRFDKV